jgi:hypothetical protein
MDGWDTLSGSSETWDGGYDGTFYVTPSDGGALASLYSNSTYDEDGIFSQKLIEKLAADTDYELTIDIVNAGYPVTDPPLRADYKIQLLAGETVLVETYNDPYVATQGVWAYDVTLEHTSGPGSDPNVGELLEIRILATDGGEVSFDNVRLTANPPFPMQSGHVYTLKLTSTDAIDTENDSVTVDVYDTSCHAARIGLSLAVENLADIASDPDGPDPTEPDCITNLYDVAAMAVDWLDDTLPIAPIAIP